MGMIVFKSKALFLSLIGFHNRDIDHENAVHVISFGSFFFFFGDGLWRLFVLLYRSQRKWSSLFRYSKLGINNVEKNYFHPLDLPFVTSCACPFVWFISPIECNVIAWCVKDVDAAISPLVINESNTFAFLRIVKWIFFFKFRFDGNGFEWWPEMIFPTCYIAQAGGISLGRE